MGVRRQQGRRKAPRGRNVAAAAVCGAAGSAPVRVATRAPAALNARAGYARWVRSWVRGSFVGVRSVGDGCSNGELCRTGGARAHVFVRMRAKRPMSRSVSTKGLGLRRPGGELSWCR